MSSTTAQLRRPTRRASTVSAVGRRSISRRRRWRQQRHASLSPERHRRREPHCRRRSTTTLRRCARQRGPTSATRQARLRGRSSGRRRRRTTNNRRFLDRLATLVNGSTQCAARRQSLPERCFLTRILLTVAVVEAELVADASDGAMVVGWFGDIVGCGAAKASGEAESPRSLRSGAINGAAVLSLLRRSEAVLAAGAVAADFDDATPALRDANNADGNAACAVRSSVVRDRRASVRHATTLAATCRRVAKPVDAATATTSRLSESTAATSANYRRRRQTVPTLPTTTTSSSANSVCFPRSSTAFEPRRRRRRLRCRCCRHSTNDRVRCWTHDAPRATRDSSDPRRFARPRSTAVAALVANERHCRRRRRRHCGWWRCSTTTMPPLPTARSHADACARTAATRRVDRLRATTATSQSMSPIRPLCAGR